MLAASLPLTGCSSTATTMNTSDAVQTLFSLHLYSDTTVLRAFSQISDPRLPGAVVPWTPLTLTTRPFTTE